ncbi:MAG: hypothetical protein ACR2MG_02840 [Pyrinomonadaceae bacterium]
MLSKSEGFEIAEKFVSQKQQQSDYNDFSAIELHQETDSFWTYVSGSQAMIDDGIIPGAFFVSIDKTDGHIWTRDEKENYYQRKSVPELQAA